MTSPVLLDVSRNIIFRYGRGNLISKPIKNVVKAQKRAVSNTIDRHRERILAAPKSKSKLNFESLLNQKVCGMNSRFSIPNSQKRSCL